MIAATTQPQIYTPPSDFYWGLLADAQSFVIALIWSPIGLVFLTLFLACLVLKVHGALFRSGVSGAARRHAARGRWRRRR